MLGLNAGTAYVSIKPDLRGMHTSVASQLRTTDRQFATAGTTAGTSYQKGFGRRFLGGLGTIAKKGAITLGTIGVLGGAAIARSSIKLEQEYGSTMSQIGAATEAPKRQLRSLSDLALKMGADTVFSANDAATAMLELAKGGMRPATIQAGGLKGTLQLAAAGGTELSTAAMIASDALNIFNLKGKDMKGVAAALAGGANASSASVESLGLALSQAGLSAADAGLSVQETTAVLAAFDNAGLKGSDAGTSLKTMLTRLTPTTKKAANEMKRLGLDFTDANGNMLPITNVAGQLQGKLGKLSDAERNSALNTMFGSDARRAAIVLMKEGDKGLARYIRKTSDMGAAQRMADSRMRGTAGAIERMKGSVETAGLAMGMALRPLTIAVSDMVADIANKAIPYIQKFGKWLRERLRGGNVFEQVSAWVGRMLPKLRQIAPDARKAFKDIGPALKEARAEMPTFTDALNVAGIVLAFLARHSDKVAKALPWLAAGFVAVKIAQVAGNVAAAVSIPLRIAEMVANRRLAASNNALIKAIKGQTGATRGSTAAEVTNTGAKNKGIVASVRSRVATAAKAVAERASALATRAMAVAQRILNAAMRANPMGLIITALIALGAAVVLAYKKSDTFRKIVNNAWDKIKQAVAFAWNRVIKPAFKAIADWVTGTLMPVMRKLWADVIKPVFRKIGDVIKWIYENVVKKYFALWKSLFTNVLFPVLRFLWEKVIKPVFGKVTGLIKSAWNNVIKPVFKALGGFIKKTVAPAFRKGVEAIGRAWDWLKNAAKTPINFIIDTVYNKGIRKFVNGLLDKFGIDTKLPYVQPIGTGKGGKSLTGNTGNPANPTILASGGVVPGFTPGRDVHTFTSPTGGKLRLSGGEAVMRPEWTRAVGKRRVDAWNRDAAHGRLNRDAWQFARGGVIPAVGSWNRHTSGYPWASYAGDINVPGSGDYGNPVRAYKDGIVAFARSLTDSYGNHIGVNHAGGSSTLYAHLSRMLVGPGQTVNRGDVIGRVGSTGNSSGPHLHFEIKGAHLAPGAAGDSGGKSWGEELVTKLANWAADKGRALMGNIPGSGIFSDLARGLGNKAINGIRDWVVSRWGGEGDTGTGPIPKGPVVNVARQLAAKRGWTGRQWAALRELVMRESSWNPNAQNPTSSAYGLFQFLDSTWSGVGGRKTSDPGKQIVYGLRYIAQRYGSPLGALRFHDANNWYDNGGWLPHGGTARNNSGKPEPVFTAAQWALLKKSLTALTLNQGRPISTAWLTDLLDNVPKSADALRREFLRARDAMRGFRTRTELARRALDRIHESERYKRHAERAKTAERAFKRTRSGEAIGEDITEARREAARALRQARRSPIGRDALREYRQANRKLGKLRELDEVKEAQRRTKWRQREAREALRSATAPVTAAREALAKARDEQEKAKGKEEKREARAEVRRARRALRTARQQPDSVRERRARERIERTERRLTNLAEERAEIEKLTKQRDRAGGQSDAVKRLVDARKSLESLREERKERRRLRREYRQASRSDILKREEKAQERLNKRLEQEKEARKRATKAAEAYKAAQEAAVERARGIRDVGLGLGTIESAPSKTSGGIVANLRRAVRTVKSWRGIVGKLMRAGLRGPILDEYLTAGPSEEAVRLGKSLLAGGQIAEIVRLQDRLNRESIRAGARGATPYRPKPVAGTRRASALPPGARGAMTDAQRNYQIVYQGMPADTVQTIVDKTTRRVRYEIAREARL